MPLAKEFMNAFKFALLIMTMALSAHGAKHTDVTTVAAQPALAISISGTDLAGQVPNAVPEGIDISPDNAKVAVVFEVPESRSSTGIWVGIWDLATKQLVRSGRIDRFGYPADPQFSRLIRFACSGRLLIVQTGPKVLGLDSETLAPLFSVGPTAIIPRPDYGEVIRSFDVAANGSRLAVLTVGIYEHNELGQLRVQVIDLPSGRGLAEWAVQGRSQHISLSPDGNKLVIDRIGAARAFSLIDSISGKLLRTFLSGWPMGSGDAIFLDGERIAAIPAMGTDEDGRFFGNGVKLFSADTGNLVEEIQCPKFGSTATLAAATRRPILASINAYQTPKEVRSDLMLRKSKPELVIFRPRDATCHSFLKPVPHGQFRSILDQYSLRLSPDGSLVSIFEDQTAKVYRVPEELIGGAAGR
jgi:hypothetical protein